MQSFGGEAGHLGASLAILCATGCAQLFGLEGYDDNAGDVGVASAGAGDADAGDDDDDAGPPEPLFPRVPAYLSTHECQTCMQSECGDEWAACQASAACSHRLACEATCDDALCADQCRHEARALLYPTTDDLVTYQHRKLEGDPAVDDVVIPLHKCDERQCSAACGVETPDFSCVGRYDPPLIYRRGESIEIMLALRGTVAGSDQLFPQYELLACNGASADCQPLASTVSDDAGVAILAVPTMDEGFPWPVIARLRDVDDRFTDFMYSRTIPMFDGYGVRSFPIPIELYRQSCAATFTPDLVDCTAEDLSGYAAVVRDCQRRFAGGIRMEYICGSDKCVQQPTAYGRGTVGLSIEPPSERDAALQFAGFVPQEATRRVFVMHDGTERVVSVSRTMVKGGMSHHEDVFPLTRSEARSLRSEPWARLYVWPELD